MLVDNGLSGGSVSGAGAVAGARVALSALVDVGVGGLGGGLDEDVSLSVAAVAPDEAVSDSLGVDAGECAGEAVGPSGCGGSLVTVHAHLDLSTGVHVSDELDEGGGDGLSGGAGLSALLIADAAAVESLGVGDSVRLSGGSSPGSSLAGGRGATEGIATGRALTGCISDGAGSSNSGNIPDNVHVLHPAKQISERSCTMTSPMCFNSGAQSTAASSSKRHTQEMHDHDGGTKGAMMQISRTQKHQN